MLNTSCIFFCWPKTSPERFPWNLLLNWIPKKPPTRIQKSSIAVISSTCRARGIMEFTFQSMVKRKQEQPATFFTILPIGRQKPKKRKPCLSDTGKHLSEKCRSLTNKNESILEKQNKYSAKKYPQKND